MDKKPLINILTRTSNRPKYFKKCIESIRAQTYKNVRHIVSVDNDETEEYVKEYGVEYIRVNKNNEIEPSTNPGRVIAHYNLYLNDLKNMVTDGWIMFLDDDDEFINNFSLESITNNIKTDNTVLLWRVKFPSIIVPENMYFMKKIIAPCHVSMIGFMFHKKYDLILFDGYTLGDFTFISKILPIIKNVAWIDKILTKIQRNDNMGGFGKRDDKK